MHGMDAGQRNESRPGNDRAAEAAYRAALKARIRHLEDRLARYEPPRHSRLDEWLSGPQRVLPPERVQSAVERLLALSAEKGVEAVLEEVCTCRELLLALAEACHGAGLTSAGQYLDYLSNPYD
jgi:hypothetical protein